jgi:arginyl-tRNA synthetase
MIAGIDKIELDISKTLKKYNIEDVIEIRYSSIPNVDIQCNNLIKYSKNSDIKELKCAVHTCLSKNSFIESIEITDKNFINMRLSSEYLKKYSKNHDLRITSSKKESILFDYGGPNIGKDLHVGHIRTLNIGRSLYNIFKIAGHDVISDIHLGDWGMPIGLILAYIEKESIDINSLTYLDLEIIYPKASELSAGNKDFYKEAQEISKKLNSKNEEFLSKWKIIYNLAIPNIKNLLQNLNYEFDLWRGESDVVDEVKTVVADAKEKNLVVEDDGALISTEKVDPPILITKSDGSYLYLTTDLGTVVHREKSQIYDKYIYVVDSRQKNHFEQVFKTVKHFNLSSSSFVHVGFGTVNGPDKKPFKTRDGNVYKLSKLHEDIKEKLKKYNENEEVLNILTNTVLTFSDLLPNRNQNYEFDLEKFTDINGKTGVYIQYAQVRARKLLESNTEIINADVDNEYNPDERKLLVLLSKFDYFYNQSLDNYQPHHLAEYLYSLCQTFNSFYANNKIFSDDVPDNLKLKRIEIVDNFYTLTGLIFNCLGIELVDSM